MDDDIPNIDETPDGDRWNGRDQLPQMPDFDPTAPVGPNNLPPASGKIPDIEAFIQDMMRPGGPMGPRLEDTQIPQDRPNGFRPGNTPRIDPSAGTKIPFTGPGWPLEFNARNPNLTDMDLDMEAGPEILQKPMDPAEMLALKMIHGPRFR